METENAKDLLKDAIEYLEGLHQFVDDAPEPLKAILITNFFILKSKLDNVLEKM